MKTEITLAQFIENHGLKIAFIPVRVSQGQDQFKTWQLHYSAVLSSKEGKEESFEWSAGYGCALGNEKIKKLLVIARKHTSMFAGEAIRGLAGISQVVEWITSGKDSKRLFDQVGVRKFMEWLLRSFTPSGEDLLNGLKFDAQCGEYSFEDFCGNCGYDTDSRSAESTWRACQENGRKLRNLIGHKAFSELLESTENL